ncbi:Naphthalene 1,2-dioxygenase system ferredoxin subunit [Thalassoglobus neptunius]|uniref:Naphthalene 1,2-dioxygenase system ferredoxin subunit n=1 Tax=Thalassoglobus neptunius TaxID=1938619 RepID=A0A5C5X2V1_9PLAN|nr:non-heme iron oxygenase ferredoxin subunit [Thalassoglobus neptunius]TWT57444.1 Naphthalene 1,2-dioxygenase system ferredoxin subunit [Thalassoglobus neptunius]
MSDRFERVGSTSELGDGDRLSVILGDEVSALVIRIADDYYCVEDVCTHDGQPMTDGELNGCELTCPRHGAKFDVRTGKALCMPATQPVETFEVEIRGEDIFVKYPND